MKVGIKTHMVLTQQDLYTIHIGPAKIASLVKHQMRNCRSNMHPLEMIESSDIELIFLLTKSGGWN